MERFDIFIEQCDPPANKQYEDFVLSGGKRKQSVPWLRYPGVMMEQLKGRCQPLLRGEDGRPGKCKRCCPVTVRV